MLPGGRFADGEVALRRGWGLGSDRHRRLELEAGVVGRGVDRHRRPVGLETLLVDVGVKRLVASTKVSKALSQVAMPFRKMILF